MGSSHWCFHNAGWIILHLSLDTCGKSSVEDPSCCNAHLAPGKQVGSREVDCDFRQEPPQPGALSLSWAQLCPEGGACWSPVMPPHTHLSAPLSLYRSKSLGENYHLAHNCKIRSLLMSPWIPSARSKTIKNLTTSSPPHPVTPRLTEPWLPS